MASASLKRVGGVGRAAMILVGIAAAAGIGAWLAGLAIVGDAEDFLDGEIQQSEFQDTVLLYSLMGLVQGAATVAAVVLVMIWMYRLASNHRGLHRGGRWGPGWAIGGWFLPPFLYVIPFLMLRELWRCSDPDVPVGGEWRSQPVSPLVTAWFVVYGPIALVAQGATSMTTLDLSNSERALAEQIVDGQTGAALVAIVGLAAGALFITMAHQLTGRHRQLIGEY
jgi:hypothetical protein